MAISNEEVLSLVPGDMIRIISEEEARERRYWDGCNSDWSIQMNEFCGSVLTVKRMDTFSYSGVAKVYVEENGFYWIADFIDSIVIDEEFDPADDTEIEGLIFAGV